MRGSADKIIDKTVDKTKEKIDNTIDKAKDKITSDDKKSNKCVVKDGKVALTTTKCTYCIAGLNGGQELCYYYDENGTAKNTGGFSVSGSLNLNGIEFACKK